MRTSQTRVTNTRRHPFPEMPPFYEDCYPCARLQRLCPWHTCSTPGCSNKTGRHNDYGRCCLCAPRPLPPPPPKPAAPGKTQPLTWSSICPADCFCRKNPSYVHTTVVGTTNYANPLHSAPLCVHSVTVGKMCKACFDEGVAKRRAARYGGSVEAWMQYAKVKGI